MYTWWGSLGCWPRFEADMRVRCSGFSFSFLCFRFCWFVLSFIQCESYCVLPFARRLEVAKQLIRFIMDHMILW